MLDSWDGELEDEEPDEEEDKEDKEERERYVEIIIFVGQVRCVYFFSPCLFFFFSFFFLSWSSCGLSSAFVYFLFYIFFSLLFAVCMFFGSFTLLESGCPDLSLKRCDSFSTAVCVNMCACFVPMPLLTGHHGEG